MLFNSFEFIFLFLPLTLASFYVVKRYWGVTASQVLLVTASLLFYAQWSTGYLLILIASMIFNYYIGIALRGHARHPKLILFLGIAIDLALLGYFKYANFSVDSLNAVFGTHLHLAGIELPLGISFFTFQQISYRMECYYGHRNDDSFLSYCTCVTFFPHLIAGPIVLYQELMPQLTSEKYRTRGLLDNLPAGLSLFLIGLFKKVVIADRLSQYVAPVFGSTTLTAALTFFDAWGATLAYTMQLYFDFSGYCDMAIGLALMFGIEFPANFNSPYKSSSIIEFWRRWHITLSRFLRDYLYIPLGGNRGGLINRYRNLFITMVLGGLWHGAGWGFILWGALHGTFLIVNHIYRSLTADLKFTQTIWHRLASHLLTFLIVALAWIPFRAPNLSVARTIFRTLFSHPNWPPPADRIENLEILGLGLLTCFILVWATPSTTDIFSSVQSHLKSSAPKIGVGFFPTWHPSLRWALYLSVLGFICFLCLTKVSEFLYFQF